MTTLKKGMPLIGLIILLAFFAGTKGQDEARNTIQKTVLWEQGVGAYNGYRIPSLIVTKNGTVLAFSEGREEGDSGDIDLLLRRSEDNGMTWSETQVVWDDQKNTCGNPCPVLDQETGRIWLFSTWNNGQDSEAEIIRKTASSDRIPYLSYSDDEGNTWSKPVNLSETCRDVSWGWYATGPGIGIQIKNGKYKGRLVIPANHSYDDPEGNLQNGSFAYGAHVLYSDDHGRNWKIGQSIRPGCNESQATELSDGTLMMNMRSYNDQHSRAISLSSDGGETWSEVMHDYQLVESRCQASIFNYGDLQGRNLHLFSNPAVPHGRTHMTIKTTFDDGESWSNAKLIQRGSAAYSCLTRLPGGRVGLLFETGEQSAYEEMVFISFDPGELFTAGVLLP